MSEEKFRLHPISAIINFIKGLKDLILPFVIIFVGKGFHFNFDPNDDRFWVDLIPAGIGLLFLFINLAVGIIRWRRFVYWFEDNELRIEYGLFVKKKRYIPFERIQSLNYKEGIFHRPFGLVRVDVETAGSSDASKAEAELTAITKKAAEMIEQEMKRAKKAKQQKVTNTHISADGIESETDNVVAEEVVLEHEERELIHKMTVKDLILLATTSSGIGLVFSGLAAFLSQAGDIIPYDKIYEEFQMFVKVGVLLVSIMVLGALLVAWMVSIVITLINYYDFTVVRENDQLIITRGLLEKKKVTIPLNRIQAIKISENPFRQLFGYVAVTVESAGGTIENANKKIAIFPLIQKKKVLTPLQELFPELNWEPTLKKSPKRARPYFYRIDFLWMAPIIAAVSIFFFPYGLFSLLIILPVIALGVWQHRTAGYAIDEKQLTIVYRGISKNTFVVEKKRIQQMTLKQTYFQKRKHIASVGVSVLSGVTGASAAITHFNEEELNEVMSWYEPSGTYQAKKN